MKKMISFLTCIPLLAALAGCAAPAEPADTPLPPQTATEQQTTPASVPSEPAPTVDPAGSHLPSISVQVQMQEEVFTATDDPQLTLLSYRYPKIQVTAPNGIGAKIAKELEEQIGSSRTIADQLLQAATTDAVDHPDWRNYIYEMSLEPQRTDSSVISLSGVSWNFAGGVHPNESLISISFDAETGEPITLEDLVTDNDDLQSLNQMVLDSLEETEERLYSGYEDLVREHFTVGSPSSGSFYFARDGVVFYFSTYEIAPYARGSIKVTIPYEKLNGLLDQRWMSPASQEATGSLEIVQENSHDILLSLQEDAPLTTLKASGAVSHLQVSVAGIQNQFRTVYACSAAEDGTRVAIAARTDPKTKVRISYMDQGTLRSFLLNSDSGELVPEKTPS